MFDQRSALSFYLLACLDEEPHGWRPLQGSLSLSSLDLHTPSLSCLQQLLTGDLVSDRLLDLLDLDERRKEKGERRREKGEGRREKGEGRREQG